MRLPTAVLALPLALALGPRALAEDVPKIAGTEVPVPKRTKFVRPEYPVEALAVGQRGIVILEVIIDEQGRVASAEVVRSVPPFDETALAAVRKWEYEVTRVDGKPVRVRHTFPITFAIKLPEMTRQEGIPELRQGVAPAIPQDASLPAIASATAEVTLDPDGRVAEAQLKSGETPWSESLLQALRFWRFALTGEPGVVSFRVQVDFVPGKRGEEPRVVLHLSGLRRSESFEVAEPAPAAAPTPAGTPSPEPPTPAESPSPAPPAPMASPSPAPSPAPPSAQAPPGPPVELIAAPSPAPSPPAPPAAPAAPGVSAVRDVALSAGVPDLLKGRRPLVPPLARMGGGFGTVEVRFSVDASGATSAESVAGPDLLKMAAKETVASWSFRRTSTERLYLVGVFTYGAESASATVRLGE